MKDLEAYIDEAIKNIRSDRAITTTLLMELMEYMKKDDDKKESVGTIAAKYVEIRQFTVVNEYESKRVEKEFWMSFWAEVNSWETGNMKPNEEKVYEAIRLIFSNPDRIDIFNKKAIYFYIREITGLNTKQVVNNLNKMRIKYRVFKKKWDKGEL